MYIDFRDGSEESESFMLAGLLDRLGAVVGISTGGVRALHVGPVSGRPSP